MKTVKSLKQELSSMDFNLGSITNAIDTAINAVKTVTSTIEGIQDAGVIFTSDSEAIIEAKIAELEALLPDLRAKAQNKLRGT